MNQTSFMSSRPSSSSSWGWIFCQLGFESSGNHRKGKSMIVVSLELATRFSLFSFLVLCLPLRVTRHGLTHVRRNSIEGSEHRYLGRYEVYRRTEGPTGSVFFPYGEGTKAVLCTCKDGGYVQRILGVATGKDRRPLFRGARDSYAVSWSSIVIMNHQVLPVLNYANLEDGPARSPRFGGSSPSASLIPDIERRDPPST
jgi:hypothetical protein